MVLVVATLILAVLFFGITGGLGPTRQVYEIIETRTKPGKELIGGSPQKDVLAKASSLLVAQPNLRREERKPPLQEEKPAQIVQRAPVTPILLSRRPGVVARADVRGNLGPPSVVVQAQPGKDWLKDRWQAASDMGGTAIPGKHWVSLDLGVQAVLSTVTLDWETAYAVDYLLQGKNALVDQWETFFDASRPEHAALRSSRQEGQSPAVKKPMPLHIIHTIPVERFAAPTPPSYRYLRLFINRPARGWGCSLWQFDVEGRPAF